MRWITRRTDHGDQVAIDLNGQVVDVDSRRSMLELLRAGTDAMSALATDALAGPGTRRDLAAVELLAPVQPPSVRDFLCFLDHMRNASGKPDLAPVWEKIPGFYFSNPHAILGPADDVAISPGCARFDFELEVAAVIGTTGSDLHPDEAGDHIAGYTIFCDWSARDLQFKEMGLGLGPAKGKDGATTIGPALVTADELEPHRNKNGFALGMRAFVNDEQVTDGSLDELDWSFSEMVAHASRGTFVQPGDVIGSGTVPGGCLLEHATTEGDNFRGWLQAGDVVRLEVDVIGSLEMTVTAAKSPTPSRETR